MNYLMQVYLEKGHVRKNSKDENELHVNLLLYVRREYKKWEQPEITLRTKLWESLEKITFGNQGDRHTEVDLINPHIPICHYFHAYQGNIEGSKLQQIMEYCASEDIGVKDYIPGFKFKLPFKH